MAQTIDEIIADSPLSSFIARGAIAKTDVEAVCAMAQLAAFQRAAEVARKLAGEIENSAGVNSLPYSEQVREMSDALEQLQPE